MTHAIFWSALALSVAKKRSIQARLAARPGQRAPLARAAAVLGSGHAMVAFGVGLALLAAVTHDRRLRVAARSFAARGAIGWIAFDVTRFVLAERRPKDGGEMRFFARDGHGVSGHALATALAYGPLVRAFDLGRGGRAALLAWIAIVSWSRVRLDEHHLWNVLLGAAMGLDISRLLLPRTTAGPPVA